MSDRRQRRRRRNRGMRIVNDEVPAELVQLPTLPLAASFGDFQALLNDPERDVTKRLHNGDVFLLYIYRKWREKYSDGMPSGVRYKMIQKYGNAEFDEDLIFRYARSEYPKMQARLFLRGFTH